MAYDPNLDKQLLKLEVGQLQIGVFKYGSGAPKLRMVRIFEDAEGKKKFGKSGGLSWEEVQFLAENMSQILKTMDEAK